MAIQVNRRGSDSVELSADDRAYYDVSYDHVSAQWVVQKNYRGVIGFGEEVGRFQTASEAVESVKATLLEKESELTDALGNI